MHFTNFLAFPQYCIIACCEETPAFIDIFIACRWIQQLF